MRGWPNLLLANLGLPLCVLAGDPPKIDHQPSPCSIPDKPITLCATISTDTQVARARIYFRPAGDDYYSFVDMTFGGISYCGTLPAPREGKVRVVEYYLQAIDDQYQSQRLSTYQINIQPEGVCEFPPVDKDAGKLSIVVYATAKKQGKKLHDAFQSAGVTFVPVAAK